MNVKEISLASSSNRHLPSDAELVSRALEGDTWAEEAIFRKYVHFVTSLAAKLLRRRAEVDDVVQDTFLQVYRDLGKLNDAERFKQWLASITVRRVQSRYRRRKIKQVLGVDSGMDDERLSEQLRVEASQEVVAELGLLDSVFDELSISERSCWVLRKFEGYRLSEIAVISGCSLATVKRRIRCADQKVEKYVNRKAAL